MFFFHTPVTQSDLVLFTPPIRPSRLFSPLSSVLLIRQFFIKNSSPQRWVQGGFFPRSGAEDISHFCCYSRGLSFEEKKTKILYIQEQKYAPPPPSRAYLPLSEIETLRGFLAPQSSSPRFLDFQLRSITPHPKSSLDLTLCYARARRSISARSRGSRQKTEWTDMTKRLRRISLTFALTVSNRANRKKFLTCTYMRKLIFSFVILSQMDASCPRQSVFFFLENHRVSVSPEVSSQNSLVHYQTLILYNGRTKMFL